MKGSTAGVPSRRHTAQVSRQSYQGDERSARQLRIATVSGAYSIVRIPQSTNRTQTDGPRGETERLGGEAPLRGRWTWRWGKTRNCHGCRHVCFQIQQRTIKSWQLLRRKKDEPTQDDTTTPALQQQPQRRSISVTGTG